jgi:hypothetical protein
MTPRTDRPYRQAALALMSHPPKPEQSKPYGHRQFIVPMLNRRRG